MPNSTFMFLKSKLIRQYGSDIAEEILLGLMKRKITSFRVNMLKANNNEIIDFLNVNNYDFSAIPFFKEGYVIRNKTTKEIVETDLFKKGKIYLQNPSSMLPPIILEPNENEDILDMAAAPGGKTTQIASMTNNKSHITACEMNQMRAKRLLYNLQKQGATNVNVMVTDARKIEEYFSFDKVLLDAPCSGSGTLDTEDEHSMKNFTQELLNKTVKSQEILLNKALSVLKVGKEMVYSTCSILKEENEDILSKVLKKYNCSLIPIDDNIKKHLPLLPCDFEEAICVKPNEYFEGFFVAKIKKNG